MKKIIALVLALVMVLSLSTVAFAEESTTTLPSLGDVTQIVTAAKTVLDKAVEFAGKLKESVTYFSTALNWVKGVLPGLSGVSTVVSTVKTNVTTLYNTLKSMQSAIAGAEKLADVLKQLASATSFVKP